MKKNFHGAREKSGKYFGRSRGMVAGKKEILGT
jgi:hypothetical protein